ncbi:galactose-1-phosphate uridylyltransferase [Tundrisphaera sp. TA3]|uniref:galactose-1-phosphate uridylyltransferase n=1 Tax=Tundrisphaera sp. TA3 TaxID=3435775 RepID=UPI003EBA2E2F
MPELRKDPIVGRWVIIAIERAKRPHDFRHQDQSFAEAGSCPFCEGNEDKTPPEILARRERGSGPGGPGWRVRVVPNKYPALMVEGSLNKRGEGIYDRMTGIGAHEVIIESPEHKVSLTELPQETIIEVFEVYRDRLVDLRKDPRLVHGIIFKNVGPAAGASLEHTHSQLIVTPTVPITVQEEINGGLEFFRYRGRCIYCDMVQQEQSTKSRVVLETEHFTAFCPYASRFPFETWIVPNLHASHYETIAGPDIADVGRTLDTVLKKLEKALDSPPYNYIIHTAPFDQPELAHYHWHIEIIPRLTRVAGFEWGSGFYINPVPPEDAARFLREA